MRFPVGPSNWSCFARVQLHSEAIIQQVSLARPPTGDSHGQIGRRNIVSRFRDPTRLLEPAASGLRRSGR